MKTKGAKGMIEQVDHRWLDAHSRRDECEELATEMPMLDFWQANAMREDVISRWLPHCWLLHKRFWD